MSIEAGIERHFQHGALLLAQHRWAEAEQAFRSVLAGDPENPIALHNLALCRLNLGAAAEALEISEAAVRADPEDSDHHALRAFALVQLDRDAEGEAAAREAIALDPRSTFACNALTSALLGQRKWADAEAAARSALEIDADDPVAANQLATALRLQNRLDENAEHLSGMLARDPENAWTHANAGWQALQAGARVKAEEHFLEALRLDPEFEHARDGLKEAFKSRSPFYRAYLGWCFFMQRLGRGRQWAVILGLYLGFRFLRAVLTGSLWWLGLTLTLLYLLFVFWVFVARGVGGLLLLRDRRARHALTREERREAVTIGGGLAAGLLLAAGGMMTGYMPALVLGSGAVLASIPLSLVFHNASRIGRWLFGAVGLFTVGLGAAIAAALGIGSESMVNALLPLTGTALLAVMITTWLANMPLLHRAR